MEAAKPGGEQVQPLWRSRLNSALRTTLACTIVACATLYGPGPLRRMAAFPAFAYLTAVLIVSDATVGDAVRGCCHALYATVQVIPPSVFTLWMVGPERFTSGLAAVAVAVGAFAVALPESTPLLSKRIAFGQLVIMYVGTVVHGGQTGVVMHPLNIATSTALGASSALLAVLLPYPRLAYFQVRKSCLLYAANASKRLNLFVEALSAQDNQKARDLISKANFSRKEALRHLQRIQKNLKGLHWERPHRGFLKLKTAGPIEKLQDLESPMKGMEIALSSCSSFPIANVDQDMRDTLQTTKAEIELRLEQVKCSVSFESTTAPESREELNDKGLQTLGTVPMTPEHLPALFFLFCMRFLHGDYVTTPHTEHLTGNDLKLASTESRDLINWVKHAFRRMQGNFNNGRDNNRLVFASKCSLSLALAVLFGLLFNKENGYWSGLTIAICFVPGRHATFTAANARAQGTALGSVYGVLCCFIFQKFMNFRLLPLIPWIIFTSFLRYSRMYGQGGGISAVLGALLILGRKGYGPPTTFAIDRLIEASIGLLCFIVVETISHPARAATLAKIELSRCLGTLRECIEDIVLCTDMNNIPASTFEALGEKQRKFKFHVKELEKFTEQAELEPNFWFLPFRSASYNNLLESLSNITDLVTFMNSQIKYLSLVSENFGHSGRGILEQVSNGLGVFKEIGSSLKCLQEVTSINSLAQLKRELKKRTGSDDIESGKPPRSDTFWTFGADEGEVKKISGLIFQQLSELAGSVIVSEAEEKLKSLTILSLSGLGFCIDSLMKETTRIEKEIKELLKLENPSIHI